MWCVQLLYLYSLWMMIIWQKLLIYLKFLTSEIKDLLLMSCSHSDVDTEAKYFWLQISGKREKSKFVTNFYTLLCWHVRGKLRSQLYFHTGSNSTIFPNSDKSNMSGCCLICQTCFFTSESDPLTNKRGRMEFCTCQVTIRGNQFCHFSTEVIIFCGSSDFNSTFGNTELFNCCHLL